MVITHYLTFPTPFLHVGCPRTAVSSNPSSSSGALPGSAIRSGHGRGWNMRKFSPDDRSVPPDKVVASHHHPILVTLRAKLRFLGTASPLQNDTIALKTTTFFASPLAVLCDASRDCAVSAKKPRVIPASQDSFAQAEGSSSLSLSSLSLETLSL